MQNVMSNVVIVLHKFTSIGYQKDVSMVVVASATFPFFELKEVIVFHRLVCPFCSGTT